MSTESRLAPLSSNIFGSVHLDMKRVNTLVFEKGRVQNSCLKNLKFSPFQGISKTDYIWRQCSRSSQAFLDKIHYDMKHENTLVFEKGRLQKSLPENFENTLDETFFGNQANIF